MPALADDPDLCMPILNITFDVSTTVSADGWTQTWHRAKVRWPSGQIKDVVPIPWNDPRTEWIYEVRS